MRFLYLLAFFWASAAPAWGEDRALDLQCLREAYGDLLCGTEQDAEGREWLVFCSGKRALYDDGRDGDAAWTLEHGDVRDSMAQPYPLEPQRPVPDAGVHPGRVRSYAFLRAVYGETRQEVQAQLEHMGLAGQKIQLSRAAGAAAALRRVNDELRELLREKPALRRYVTPLGGGYSWRCIVGTGRMSAHSFGLAVDLNPQLGAYWQWSKGVTHPSQKTYPTEIVRIFENNGFVWGGKWREYDLMHFEYRPEIICKARKKF